MKPELLTDLLNRAKEEEMGIIVTTNNPQAMKFELSSFARNKPEFAELMIAIPSTENEIYIIKKSVELDP